MRSFGVWVLAVFASTACAKFSFESTATPGAGSGDGSAAGGSARATVTSVQVSPSSATVPLGGTLQLSATAFFSDGTSQPVTSAARWRGAGTASVGTTGLVDTRFASPGTFVAAAFWPLTGTSLSGTSTITITDFNYTVTGSGDANEMVSPSGGQTVSSGNSQAFTVTPSAGYTPTNAVGGTCPVGTWAGNVYTTGAIIADCSVAFTSARIVYTVTPSGDGNESISPGAGQPVNAGDTSAFTVNAKAGFTVSATVGGSCTAGSWLGNVYATGAIAGNCTVTFSATPITYTVTASGDAHETIVPLAPQTVSWSGPAQLTVTASAGYAAYVGGTCPFGGWSGNQYTTGAVLADCSVTFFGKSTTIPTGLQAFARNGGVYLIWDSVSGATSYNLYWNTTGSPTTADTKIAGVASGYTHTGLANQSGPYYYVVTAVTSAGEGPISPVASAQPSYFHYLPDTVNPSISAPSATVYTTFVDGSVVYTGTAGGIGVSGPSGYPGTALTTANGLASNVVNGLFVAGASIYAATPGGLSFSGNSGASFTTYLSGTAITCVFVSGSTIYAGASVGLLASTDGGATFTPLATLHGIPSSIAVSGATMVVGTSAGIGISTDGATFTNYTTANGLGSNTVAGVYVAGSSVYAATTGGLSISTNGGASFANYTTSSGLGSINVRGVFVAGGAIYAATAQGLSVSPGIGNRFTNYSTASGFLNPSVRAVTVANASVFASTDAGLAISWNGLNVFHVFYSGSGFDSGGARDVAAADPAYFAATPNQCILGALDQRSDSVALPSNAVAFFGNYRYFGTTGEGMFVEDLTGSTNGLTGIGFNLSTTDGLASDDVYGVYADGNTVYAATHAGLSIGPNLPACTSRCFTTVTSAQGLASNHVAGVYASGTTVYAATDSGLSLSTNGAVSFTTSTTANGLGSNSTNGVYAVGTTVYVATQNGLSISTDGGHTFANTTTLNGLPSNVVNRVYDDGAKLYVAMAGGLAISSDGGSTFTTYTTADGLGSNAVASAYASGAVTYAATAAGVFANSP